MCYFQFYFSLQNLISGESSRPGLQMAVFFLCPHVAFPQSVHVKGREGRERGNELSGVSLSSYKDSSSIRLGPYL